MKIFFLFITFILFIGCSSHSNTITIYSNLESLNVNVSGTNCITPCSLAVDQLSKLVIKVNGNGLWEIKGKKISHSNRSAFDLLYITDAPVISELLALASIPVATGVASQYTYKYDPNSIYIYMDKYYSYLYDLNHSAFAFSMNYYPELSTTYTTEHEKRIKELSKLSDLDSEHIQSRLKQTIEAVAFADIISKDTLAKIILKKYKDIKSNKDKYVKQMANELRFNETFMDRLITESSNANELVYNIYNYDLIQKVGDYCDYFYLDIVSEYSEGSGEYLSGLSELSGLSIKELLTIVEVTEDKASFIERVIKEMEVKGEN